MTSHSPTEQHPKQCQERLSNASIRRGGRIAIATALAVSAFFSVKAASEHWDGRQPATPEVTASPSPSVDPEQAAQKAAKAVALGQKCTIAAVEDLGEKQPDHYVRYPHDDVRVALAVEPKAAALPYLDQYEHNNSVVWNPPQAVAKIASEPMHRPVRQGDKPVSAEFRFGDANPQGIVSLPASLPNGSRADLYFLQETRTVTFDDNEGERYVGWNGCTGEMVKQGDTWVLDASAPKPHDKLASEIMYYQ